MVNWMRVQTEVFLSASHHKLNNLVVIIDRNHLQSIGSTETTLALEPLHDKLVSFGWNVILCDGHNHISLLNSYKIAKNESSKPSIIIANTIKGRGVSFMEDEVLWHYRSPSQEELDSALGELS